MMEHNRSIFIRWQGVMLALGVVLYGLLEPAYCQVPTSRPFAERQSQTTDGTVLLLQQTPSEGGEISPGAGVHQFDLNTEVTLTAVPKPGYFFVYWMGDVSAPTADSTIVYLDAPKIVIAVFERSEFEFTPEEKRVQNTLGGGGRLYPSAADYSRGGISAVGGKRAKGWSWPSIEIPEEFPVPEEEEEEEVSEDFPVPLPEPATLLLLGVGSLLIVGRKTKR